MLQFQQLESTAERRRWLFQLKAAPVENEIPAGDKNGVNVTFTLVYTPVSGSLKLSWNGQLLSGGGVDYTLVGNTITMVSLVQSGETFLASYEVTSMTGQTGTGYISKNGGAGVATTNSMVEVDSTNMPGLYYIELTASELDTLGYISFYVKTATSIAVTDNAIVSYNDPYLSAGGFSGGTGAGSLKLTKKQLESLAEMVWKYQITEDKTAKDKLLEASESVVVPALDLKPVLDKIDGLDIPVFNIDPIIERIDKIVIPTPKDFTEDIKNVGKNVERLIKETKPVVEDFNSIVDKLQSRIVIANEDVNVCLKTINDVNAGYAKLQTLMDEYGAKLADQTDMDKRFDSMASALNKRSMEDMVKEIQRTQEELKNNIKKVLVTVTETKFDILQELK